MAEKKLQDLAERKAQIDSAPAFVQGDHVCVSLRPDKKRDLDQEFLEAEITFGDSAREGQIARARAYTVRSLENNEARGIKKGDLLKFVKIDQLLHL